MRQWIYRPLALAVFFTLIAAPISAKPDTFEQMAAEMIKTLDADTSYDGFASTTFVARPFVIKMIHAADANTQSLEARKKRIGQLAQGIWRNWLGTRKSWELKSTCDDTLENPRPFVWVSFHDAASYGRYMKVFRPNSTAGSLAFYGAKTHYVYTRENPDRDPSIILIHETTHQLMDRFSKVPSTGYQNYAFTEGLAEYFAGHSGEGETLKLGAFNRPRRANQIRRFHTYYDGKQHICYPWHHRKMQITPDDWIFFDVPMLLTFRDITWTKAISNAMIKHFERSDYLDSKEGKRLTKGGQVYFHAAFYAYAWAFTHWLRDNYPKEYDRYAKIILNTDRGGDAEVFLEAFDIKPVRPLPDIVSLVGPNNRDVKKNMRKAVACLDQRIAILRQTPAIQEMHRKWADWMRTTFPKLDDDS